MTHDGLRIDRLDPSRAAETADVYVTAYANYPSWRHLFPDPVVRRRVLQPFMAATARDAAVHGRAMVAEDDHGIVGIALWMPPGAFPLSARRKARMTPALLRAALAARGSFPAFMRVGSALAKAHPREPSWYLQSLVVHPRAQRRGVGTILVAPILALADEAGLSCYLQTSNSANIAYYQRFGFEVIQPVIQAFSGGPSYIGMARRPMRSQGPHGLTHEGQIQRKEHR